MSQALNESCLLSFIDDQGTFVVSFLEGQKLIQDIVLLQASLGEGFSVYRQAILGFQHLLHFYKDNEQLGFYFEQKDPVLAFKLESSSAGYTRCILLQEKNTKVTDKWSGIVRLMVAFPSLNREPNQSIIDVKDASVEEIFNEILKRSFQIPAEVGISQEADQSYMITQLPDFGGKAAPKRFESIAAFREAYHLFFARLFSEGINDKQAIISRFKEVGLKPIKDLPVIFHCPCSRERFLTHMKLAYHESQEKSQGQDEQWLVTCEFCSKKYRFSSSELDTP